MKSGSRAVALAAAILSIAVTSPVLAVAPTGPVEPPPPPLLHDRDWVFLQAGLGLVEVGHLEAGFFVTPKIDIEVWLAWAAVFGSRAGVGATYVFGTSEEGRTPKGGVTVGARVMLNGAVEFDNHGDDLSS